MPLPIIFTKVEKLISSNSSSILTAFGISGTIVTAYLTAKATFKAAYIIQEEERLTAQKVDGKEAVKAVWKLYIPPAISGTVTIVSIIGATTVLSRKATALTTAYSLSEHAFSEYKAKTLEALGTGKEKKIRDSIAEDHVRNSPPQPHGLILSGNGDVLCCELYTGRYFHCDMEKLRQTQNNINAKLFRESTATLNDFYYDVGLPYTTNSSVFGWHVDKQLNLDFSTVMSDDNRPCLAFSYNYVRVA